MADPKMSVTDFAKSIKTKYPQYNDMSDGDLARAMIAKYPTYRDQVDFRTFQPAAEHAAASGEQEPLPAGRNDLEAMHQAAVGAGKSMIETPYNIYKGVANVIQGRPADTPRNPDFEDALQSKNRAQTVGKVAEQAGEFAVGEGAVSAGAKALKIAPKAGKLLSAAGRIARSAAVGATDAVPHGESATAGAVGGGVGAGLAEGVAALKPLSQTLIDSARGNWNRLLGATTDVNKRTAAKIVPEMVDRGVVAATRKSAADQFATRAQDFGQQIDNVWQSLPQDKDTPAKPILDAIDEAKKEFQVPGGQKVVKIGKRSIVQPGQTVNVEPEVVKNFDRLKNIVAAATDDTTGNVNVHSLRTIRQAWDEIVSQKGGFVKDLPLPDRAGVVARRSASNAIRDEIGKAVPDLQEINKQYTFWRRAENIMRDTLTRTSSQSQPIGQQIMKGVGATAGAPHGTAAAFITGKLASDFRKITTSAGWNSVSALTKSRLAAAIANGDKPVVRSIVQKIAFSIGIGASQPASTSDVDQAAAQQEDQQ